MTQELFIEIINFIINRHEESERFSKELQKFAHDKNFTGYYDDVPEIVTEWLEKLMDDKYKTIKWWLWDCPNHGLGSDKFKTVLFEDKEITINTPKDLYVFLTEFENGDN